MATLFAKVSYDLTHSRTWQSDNAVKHYIDLCFMAALTEREFIIKKKAVALKRGQLVTTQKMLEKRWGCSRGKVRHELSDMEKDGLISLRTENIYTIIILTHYATPDETPLAENQESRQANNQPNTLSNSTLTATLQPSLQPSQQPTPTLYNNIDSNIESNIYKEKKERKERRSAYSRDDASSVLLMRLHTDEEFREGLWT